MKIKESILNIMNKLDTILEDLEEIQFNNSYIKSVQSKILNCYEESKNKHEEADKLKDIIREQSIIIKSLLNEKCEDRELELLIVKTYRHNPYIIKDGKRIDNENMTSFNVDWDRGSLVNVDIGNE